MVNKKLIVSVHDVTPKFSGELTEIVSELEHRGFNHNSILVVPNWVGEYDVSKDEGFSTWLQDLQAKGNEMVQHGNRHVNPFRNYPNFREQFMGESFAQGTGEFQNFGYDIARSNLRAGKSILKKAGLDDIVGFVAPAWLVNPEVEEALRKEGFNYHVYTNFRDYVLGLSVIPIKNLNTGDEIRTREIAFEGSRKLIDAGTRALAWALSRNKNTQLMRVAIHPQDIRYERPFDYALKILEEAKVGRELCTYRDLFSSKPL